MTRLNAWLKANVGVLILIGTLMIGLVLQWSQFSQAAAQTWKNDYVIQQHLLDFQRHIDPVRDERQRQDLNRRLDSMEAKIDELLKRR